MLVRMKKNNLLFILCLFFIPSFSQISPNEKLVYTASYNMSGLMTQIAQVTMETELVKTSKKSFLHLNFEAATYSKWDSFFKVRDQYESYVDPVTLRTSLYTRSIYEGGYTKTEKYIFSADGLSINSTSSIKKRPEIKKSFSIGNTTRDVISMIYKLRTVDFSNFKSGQSVGFIIAFDEKEYPVSVKYMGKETVTAGNLGKKECYVLSIAAKTDKLKGKDKNLIWLTADSRKVPVLVRFSIPVGTGQLALSISSGK